MSFVNLKAREASIVKILLSVIKLLFKRLPGVPMPPSTDYKRIKDNSEIRGLENAWQDPRIPIAQRKIVDMQIREMYEGHPPLVFQALAEAVKETDASYGEIVEVGCSSGHYSEVLAFLLAHPINYLGLDYSYPFIKMARAFYPRVSFMVADASALPIADKSCDILISGCVLLHVSDYRRAIAESVRVSRKWIIFHRTPIIEGNETQIFEKKAYGVRCLEMSFSEAELFREFTKVGITVVKEFVIEGNKAANSEQVSQKTYLCLRDPILPGR